MTNNKKAELLAPAGNKESFISAINANADAVYVGGIKFGARNQAQNFSTEELIDMIKYAHLRDCKVYVTVNTLIKDEELDEAINFIKELYLNNVDAVIIQDIGLARILLQMFPDLTLHASTQMNIHSISQAKFLKMIGFKRIILARECSIETIKQIKENVDIEIEVFVHGALCMCYSGNCYMSSIIGKRSGNRGRCAQPCRLLYSLNTSKPSFLLSPKDLMLYDNLKQLLDLNIDSLKIEGRMKRSEYVALITSKYKKRIEEYYHSINSQDNNDLLEMKEMFNREFTKGYIFHENNKDFTNTLYSNHIGVVIGKIKRVEGNYAYIKLSANLENDDSIRILGKNEDAVTISQMYINNMLIKKAKAGDLVKVRCHKEVSIDALVLRTTTKSLLDKYSSLSDKKIDITGEVYLVGKSLALKVKKGDIEVVSLSKVDVSEANNPSSIERIESQIRKCNNTVYKFSDISIRVKNVFLPISIINDLRREALAMLDSKRLEYPKKRINQATFDKQSVYEPFFMMVKVSNEEQYLAARTVTNKQIIVEEESLYNKYKEKDTNLIFLNHRIDNGNLYEGGVQNYNLVGKNHWFTSNYMNIFNSSSVLFMHQSGIKRVGLSIELSGSEIEFLIDNFKKNYGFNPNTFVMCYGRYELMIMKHCIINKACDKSALNCGECLKKHYYLKDRLGFNFPLIKANNCNVKLLNSKCLNLINDIDYLKEIGVNGIMIDFTIEDKDEVIKVLNAYINKIDNNIDPNENIVSEVTYGHFNEGVL